jgi:16S rRNA G527 N7-methylase RsmG
MSINYKIPETANKDLIDILILIEADVGATTGLPPSLCKLLVAQMLMTLVEALNKQAESLKILEDEEPETIN